MNNDSKRAEATSSNAEQLDEAVPVRVGPAETSTEPKEASSSGGVGKTSEDPISAAGLTVSLEELKHLKEQAAKAAEHWERLLRTTADFDNFKKRAARERAESAKYANESLLQKLIPVLDNFEMALNASSQAPEANVESLTAGIQMIYQQLKGSLAEAGLEEIDASGQIFDPNFHEAVSQRDTEGVPEGQVVQQLRKGYKLRDRLLRPAAVVVAKSPAT
jgi:molecular chaperone GrpE